MHTRRYPTSALVAAALAVLVCCSAPQQAAAARLWLPGFGGLALAGGAGQEGAALVATQAQLQANQLRRLLEELDAKAHQLAAPRAQPGGYGLNVAYGDAGVYGGGAGRRSLLAPALHYAGPSGAALEEGGRVEQVRAAGSAWQPSAGSIVLSGGRADGDVDADAQAELMVQPVPDMDGY